MGISTNWLHPSWNPTGSVNVSQNPNNPFPRIVGVSGGFVPQPAFGAAPMFTGPGFQRQTGYMAPTPFFGGGGGGGFGGSPSYGFDRDPMTVAEKRARGMLMGNNKGGLTANPLADTFGKPLDRTDRPQTRISGSPDDQIQGFADGGFPVPGKPALVGENGPEIIVPTVPTMVIPNQDSAATFDSLNSQFMSQPGASTFAEPRGLANMAAQAQNAKMGGPLAPKDAANNNPQEVVQIPNADRSIKGMFGELPYPTRNGVPLNDPSQKWKPGGLPTSDLSVDMGDILRNQLKSGNPGMVQGALSLMQHGTQAANAQDFHRDSLQEQRNLYDRQMRDINTWRKNDREAKLQESLQQMHGLAQGYEAAKMLPGGTTDYVKTIQDPAIARGFIESSIKAHSKTLDEDQKLQAAKQALAYLVEDPNSGVSKELAQTIIDHNPTAAGINGFLQHRAKTPVKAPLSREFITDPATGKHFVQGEHIVPSDKAGERGLTSAEAARIMSDARKHRSTVAADTTMTDAERKAELANIDAEIKSLREIAYPKLYQKQPTGSENPINSALDATKPK